MPIAEKGLRQRVLTLVGQRPALNTEDCFNCGGSTALGRLTTTHEGVKVTSCWRSECYAALQRLCQSDTHKA